MVLIQISFNPSSPTPCPSITPLYPHLPPSPYNPPMHPFPPSTHHLPPQGWNTGKLTGEERVKEKGWAAFCLPRVCACVRVRVSVCICVCVGVKYSLCGVCEAVCKEGRGGNRGSRWTASLLPAVLCPHLLSLHLPLFIFYLSLFLSFSLSVISPPMSSSFPSFFPPPCFFSVLAPSFTLCCLVADGSVGQQQHQQQQQSRSQSVSRRWGEEKGVVEKGGGGGERRRGSGIWRAWLRGPLRGSVRVRVVV